MWVSSHISRNDHHVSHCPQPAPCSVCPHIVCKWCSQRDSVSSWMQITRVEWPPMNVQLPLAREGTSQVHNHRERIKIHRLSALGNRGSECSWGIIQTVSPGQGVIGLPASVGNKFSFVSPSLQWSTVHGCQGGCLSADGSMWFAWPTWNDIWTQAGYSLRAGGPRQVQTRIKGKWLGSRSSAREEGTV